MKIKAKRTNIEYLDVEVSKEEVFKIVREALGFGDGSYVNELNNTYYNYTGDNHHNGDPEYDTRKATDEELAKWLALMEIWKALK